jgi:hypothetical protein
MYGVGVIDLLDYTNTNKYKTKRAISGLDVNGSGGGIDIDSSLWMNTNAVTSIKLFPDVGSLVQYSTFALYGVN